MLSKNGLVFFTLLNGCSSGNMNPTNSIKDAEENTLTRIADMPFVMKTKLNIEESLILGEGKSWSGQLLLSVPASKAEVFNFYVKNLEDFGWKEQTTIRGKTSILNYVGENNRVAIIMIKEDGIFNNLYNLSSSELNNIQNIRTIIKKSKIKECTLYFEFSFREREPFDSRAIKDIKESVNYWRDYINV